MTKVRVLSISVICLALLNVVLLTSIFFAGPPRHKEPKHFIVKKLNLSPSQIIQYEEMINKHKDLITNEEKKLKNLKQELYLTIKTQNKNNETDFLKKITIVQTNIELIHLNHFKEIQSICKPEQLDNFNSLIEELPHLFGRKKHKKRK